MNLKYLITMLRAMKIPGLYPIMKDWQAFVRLHFIYAALESGLLEALSTPASGNDLIQKLNVKRPQILEALLDVGLSARELSYENGSYSVKEFWMLAAVQVCSCEVFLRPMQMQPVWALT